MNDFMFWFSFVANVITILAGLIAIAGVGWAASSKAKLTFRTSVGASLTPTLNLVASSIGSNPVRNPTVSYGAVDDNGFSMWGTGEPVSNPLNRGASISVYAFDEATTHFGSPARPDEIRAPLKRGDGLFITFQWQSPLFPWLRKSVTYAWPPRLRFAGAQPARLTGRAEIKFLERTRDPKLNLVSGGPTMTTYSQTATDGTFNAIVSAHSGAVVIGLAPSWQGEFWEDIQRMLNAFAAKYSPKVKVLTVTTDENPVLADHYTADVLPRFVVLRGGQLLATQDGASSMADLESAFIEHLR